MLARTLIFRVVRRSDRSGRRRSPRERETGSFELCLPYRFSPGGGDWRSAWHRSRVPDAILDRRRRPGIEGGKSRSRRKREKFAVAESAAIPRRKRRPANERTSSKFERGRSLFRFPSAVCCRIVTGKKSSAACRLPPADATGDSLSLRRYLLLNCARRGAVLLLVRCAIAVTHQCC